MPHGIHSFSFAAFLPSVLTETAENSILRDPGAIRRDLNPQTELTPEVATKFLLANIAPAGTAPGAVVASPSKHNPDYFFHWVRDAALVMNVVVDCYDASQTSADKTRFGKLLDDYASFSAQNQLTKNPSGDAERRRQGNAAWNLADVGEPKFEVDGRAFLDGWGRPQDDGPALRAITFLNYIESIGTHALLADRQDLFRIIALDLEYVVKNWQNPSFEPWEEVRGHHFYTKLVERRALIRGAALAERLGDTASATRYAETAKAIANEIPKHWDESASYLRATLPENKSGHPEKTSDLDSQVLLATLHSGGDDDFYSVTNDRVLATAYRLIQTCRKNYAINRDELPGTVIGRYDEDVYFGGNPWVLTTAALGELYFRSAAVFAKKGEIRVTAENANFFNFVLNEANQSLSVVPGQIFSATDSRFGLIRSALMLAGDDQILRIHYHANPDGSLFEQIQRNTGYMTAAPHLTWSYASYLTLISARKAAQSVA